MRVLWFSVTPSMFSEGEIGGWIASLEMVFRKYLPDIQLGIAFEYQNRNFKAKRGNVTYYPMSFQEPFSERVKGLIGKPQKYQQLLQNMLKVVDDFKPDLIQCFGTEWPYGLIAEYTDIPVVIHLQGFRNAYDLAELSSYPIAERAWHQHFGLRSVYQLIFDKEIKKSGDNLELEILKSNHFYMGRTTWDKAIISHYIPDAHYYYCSEAIRPVIYNSDVHWAWTEEKVPTIITISQAGYLKGNEMILRTAKILKEDFNYPFLWKVAGRKESFALFEQKTGIHHEDVNIELLGMIAAEEIIRQLSESRLFIHPSIIDNSPNSLCEAQIIGCPVIAAEVGGVSDLVENHKTGFLYPYNEPHTLAFYIMDMANNRALLERLSLAERSKALARHDPAKIALNIEQIYEEIIRKSYESSNY